MRKVITGEQVAQLYNRDPFALPIWRAPVYQTPAIFTIAVQLYRLISWLVRLIARHPLAAAILAVLVLAWLNTGWLGGSYGVGQRMSIAHTRGIVHAVLQGKLRGVTTHPDPIFKLHIPDHVPDVPREVLDPRSSWRDPLDYDRQASKLRGMFEENIHSVGRSASAGG